MRRLWLRSLRQEWVPEVLELDQRSLGGLWTADGYLREIESDCSELLVLRQEDTEPGAIAALGSAWAILEEAHITIVAVHPDYQRQGLGQAMVWALLHSAWRRGLERATLEVRESNAAAIALYQKFGFREAGRRRRYYQDNGEDALVMWRGGIHHPDFPDCLNQWQQEIGDRLHQADWEILWDDSDLRHLGEGADLSGERSPD